MTVRHQTKTMLLPFQAQMTCWGHRRVKNKKSRSKLTLPFKTQTKKCKYGIWSIRRHRINLRSRLMHRESQMTIGSGAGTKMKSQKGFFKQSSLETWSVRFSTMKLIFWRTSGPANNVQQDIKLSKAQHNRAKHWDKRTTPTYWAKSKYNGFVRKLIRSGWIKITTGRSSCRSSACLSTPTFSIHQEKLLKGRF